MHDSRLVQGLNLAARQPRRAPHHVIQATTARILCRNFTPKHHRQPWVKDLPKVPTWQLERKSNTMTLPIRHPCPNHNHTVCLWVWINKE